MNSYSSNYWNNTSSILTFTTDTVSMVHGTTSSWDTRFNKYEERDILGEMLEKGRKLASNSGPVEHYENRDIFDS